MTKVDFYILQEQTVAARDHFVCRLTEKALRNGHHVVIRVENKAHADSMSQYLWSFKPEAFIPHTFADADTHTGNIAEAESIAERVIIDWQGHNTPYHDVMINAQPSIPETFSQFNKLTEVVVQDPAILAKTRENYQYYRDRGYPLQSHKLSA